MPTTMHSMKGRAPMSTVGSFTSGTMALLT